MYGSHESKTTTNLHLASVMFCFKICLRNKRVSHPLFISVIALGGHCGLIVPFIDISMFYMSVPVLRVGEKR